ncbi:Bifunctional epoxide hydrolase [Lachnellula hyalina]|uniref:Bifunctional epoxide hydrolase n=1 Tax=Lachnellula hyalina TaxID=1316788 RepID=A0A8H8QZ43_9HELO|nr:Bifunctional epoxide hydrolase [Lachnellula hyalina]TVY25498.1 Bifunctional epoxide hydrolase [Lachnellula hyalina]
MAMNPLVPNDPRVEHKYTTIEDDITYHYMLAKPEGKAAATVILLHGWPDLGLGWRFQVPKLLSLGLQVAIPDMLGYGRTSSPSSPLEYSMKKTSAHIAHIIREVTSEPVILGGHDWGAFLAWRTAMYHPSLICGVFTFCVPFFPPRPTVITLEQFVEELPDFRYQLQLASPTAETLAGRSEATLRGFLSSMFGGVTSDELPGFEVSIGLIGERLDKITSTPLMSTEILDHYVQEYSRNGLHGLMNWYRTMSINSEEELPLLANMSGFKFQMPGMIVMAGEDPALPPVMLDGQEMFFASGLKKEIIPGASHWALIHFPEESNKYIEEFVKDVLGK